MAEVAAALALAHGELAEEILVNAAECVEVERGRDLGDFLSRSLRRVLVKRLKVLGSTPASCGLCFSTSRMAALTFAPMAAASGRIRRWSKRASGER